MKERLHTLLTHLLVAHLAFGPIISMAQTAENGEGETPEVVREEPSINGSQIGGIIQGVGQQVSQMKQQQASMAQRTALMGQLRPQKHSSKLFPQCQMPLAEPNFPKNACSAPPQNEQHRSMQEAYQSASVRYEKFYNKMMSNARNASTNQGLKCLMDAKDNTMANLNQQINSLQALSDRIKKENQKFRDRAEEMLDKIQDSHGLLHGGAGSEDLDARSANISDMFSPSCQNVIKGQAQSVGTQNAPVGSLIRNMGLIGGTGNTGVKPMVESIRQEGNNFRSNKNSIVSDINQYIENFEDEINESGVEALENGEGLANELRGTGLTSFGGGDGRTPGRIDSAIQREYRELATYKEEVQEEITRADLDYNIPPMDNNFSVDFEHFEAGAENFFRKQYVNDCVTGEKSTGIALDEDDILSNLSSNRVSNDTYIVNKYQNALQNILQSDVHMEDKLAEIRALDQEFQNGSIKLTFQDRKSNRREVTPYEYYRNVVNACDQKYEQDETFSKSGEGVSAKKKVERIKKRLAELKNRHQDFSSNVASEISDTLIRCNGSPLKDSPESCSPDVFEPSSSKFCVEHAQQCSNRINKCYGEIDKVAEQEKTKMKNNAQVFNREVESFVAQQEQILNNVKGRLAQTQETLKRFFPGANYDLAEDLLIEMPGKEDAQMLGKNLGVKLRGGGQEFLDQLDQLPKKIGKLKEQLRDQKGKVKGEIKEHIDQQRMAMQNNKQKWQGLFDSCKQSIARFDQKQQQQHKNQQEQFQERSQKVAQFCNRFNNLRLYSSNPMPACDSQVESLADAVNASGDLKEAAPHISSQAKRIVVEYHQACASHQGESSSVNSGDDDDNMPILAQKCEEGETVTMNDVNPENILNNFNDHYCSEDATENEESDSESSEEASEDSSEDNCGIEEVADITLDDDEDTVDLCKFAEKEAFALYQQNDRLDNYRDLYKDPNHFDSFHFSKQYNEELESENTGRRVASSVQLRNKWQRLGEAAENSSCQAVANQQRGSGNSFMDQFQRAFNGETPDGNTGIYR